MTAMRAALLREFGSLVVAEVPVPEPGAGEVLVRVRACGICGTDLKIVAGAYRGTWPPAPRSTSSVPRRWAPPMRASWPDTSCPTSPGR